MWLIGAFLTCIGTKIQVIPNTDKPHNILCYLSGFGFFLSFSCLFHSDHYCLMWWVMGSEKEVVEVWGGLIPLPYSYPLPKLFCFLSFSLHLSKSFFCPTHILKVRGLDQSKKMLLELVETQLQFQHTQTHKP